MELNEGGIEKERKHRDRWVSGDDSSMHTVDEDGRLEDVSKWETTVIVVMTSGSRSGGATSFRARHE